MEVAEKEIKERKAQEKDEKSWKQIKLNNITFLL